jgi:hypothetical protein
MINHNFKLISKRELDRISNHDWSPYFIFKVCEICKLLCGSFHDLVDITDLPDEIINSEFVNSDEFRLYPVAKCNYSSICYLNITDICNIYSIAEENLLSCGEELMKNIL